MVLASRCGQDESQSGYLHRRVRAKRGPVTRSCRKLSVEKLRNVYSLSNKEESDGQGM